MYLLLVLHALGDTLLQNPPTRTGCSESILAMASVDHECRVSAMCLCRPARPILELDNHEDREHNR